MLCVKIHAPGGVQENHWLAGVGAWTEDLFVHVHVHVHGEIREEEILHCSAVEWSGEYEYDDGDSMFMREEEIDNCSGVMMAWEKKDR